MRISGKPMKAIYAWRRFCKFCLRCRMPKNDAAYPIKSAQFAFNHNGQIFCIGFDLVGVLTFYHNAAQ